MATEKRLIDANAVIKDIDNYYHNSQFPHPRTTWLRGLELALGLLLKAPTVEAVDVVGAVEVVRCRDCISRVWDSETKEYWCDNPLGLCAMLKDGDFCSYGERRTDG